MAAYIEPSKEAPCFEEATEVQFVNDTITGKSSVLLEDSSNATGKARALSVGIDAVTATGNEKEARGFVADDFSMAFHVPAYITIFPVIILFLLQSMKIIEAGFHTNTYSSISPRF